MQRSLLVLFFSLCLSAVVAQGQESPKSRRGGGAGTPTAEKTTPAGEAPAAGTGTAAKDSAVGGSVGGGAVAGSVPAAPTQAPAGIAAPNYRMIMVAVEKGSVMIKCRPSTGAMWRMWAGKWYAIAEADSQPLPKGDYEVVAVSIDNGAGWHCNRIERSTGKIWEMLDDKWVAVKDH